MAFLTVALIAAFIGYVIGVASESRKFVLPRRTWTATSSFDDR
jgi:hypothetical protein